MATYYRLAQIENTLPTHWAYRDAWEWNNENGQGPWVDNRQEGFQVFGEVGHAILAAMGFDMDGDYPEELYPQLLLIEADDYYVSDGCSMFFAIDHDGVLGVKGISTKAAIEAATKLHEDSTSECELSRGWAEESEEQLRELLSSLAEDVEIQLIETLPQPKLPALAGPF